LRVVEIGHGKLEAILDSMRTIAAEAGAGGKGEALVGGLRKQLNAVAAGVRSKPVKSVVFIVGRNPGNLTGLIAAGGGSYFNDLFEYAGGRNIFAQSPQEYLKISMEELLARNPEVIIDMGDMSETTRVTEEQKRAAAALWVQYPSLKAVRGRAVHAVSSDIYVVPGPRLVDAAKAFAHILHPVAKR
jgi:ABC-type Fe3+-hydroxamate transport system substrate-binding protein